MAGAMDDPYIAGQMLLPRTLYSMLIWAQAGGVDGIGANVTLDVLIGGVAVPGMTAVGIPMAAIVGPGITAIASDFGAPIASTQVVSVRLTIPVNAVAVSPVNIHCRLEWA